MRFNVVIICLLSLLLTSCIFIDDDCDYERKCNYVTHCETICDYYGYNCAPDNCYEIVDHCWDEYVCYN
jgi:hypothetical protein